MGYIIELCQYIAKGLRSALFALMSIPGLIVSGLVGAFTFVVALFTDWDYTTELVSKIDTASAYIAEQFGVLHQNSSPVLDILVSFLAVDTFVECMVLLVTATVALVVSTFCTFLLGVALLAVGVLLVRGILKVIRVCSGGFVDP